MAKDVPDVFSGALGKRFDYLRHLGQGGMAEVYLARDRFHEREVALKIVRASPSAGEDAQAARAPLAQRNAARGAPAAPLHPGDLRGRQRGRPQLPRHGVPPGRHALDLHLARCAAAPFARGGHRVQGEPRPRVRQHPGPAAPRREAGQRAARGRRHAQDQRLRRRLPPGRGTHAGDRRRHPRLHAAGTFRGRRAQRAARHLRHRRHGVQPAERRLPAQVRDPGGAHQREAQRAGPFPSRPGARGCPRRSSPPSIRPSTATAGSASAPGRRSARPWRRRSRTSSRNRPP